MTKSIHDIKKELRRYKRKFYLTELTKGGIFFTALALSTLLLITFVEYITNLPSFGRLVLLIIYVGTVTYGLAKWIIWPSYQLLNINKFLTNKQAAQKIGLFFPEIRDKLTNTLELIDTNTKNNALILASIAQKSQSFEGINFEHAVNNKDNKKHIFRYLIPAVSFLGLVITIQPSIVTTSTERIVTFHNIEYDIPSKFEIKNKPNFLIAGDQQKLEVKIDGRNGVPSQAYAFVNGTQKLLEKSGNRFFVSLKPSNKQERIELQFSAAGYRSNTNHFDVLYRPNLEEVTFKIEYPRYTKIK